MAVQENAKGRGKRSSGGALIGTIAAGAALAGVAPSAFAGGIVNCNPASPAGSYYSLTNVVNGAWTTVSQNGSNVQPAGCSNTSGNSGIILNEASQSFLDPNSAYLAVGKTYDNSTAGTIKLYGPNGILLQGATTTTGLATFQAGADMSNTKIANLAAGTVSSGSQDAVNGSQLFNVAQSTATALGGGSSVNGAGAVTAPSFPLANANSINGTSGAATNIGSAFSTVDTALGKLNTSIATLNNTLNGGIKYFHANSTLADSSASGANSVAVGDRANSMGGSSVAVGDAATAVGVASIAIGNNAANVTGANNSIAIGGDSRSGGMSVTIGNGANSSDSSWAVAVGANSNVSGALGIAVGAGATATTANSVALGANALANSTTLNSAGFTPVGGTAITAGTAAGGEVSVGKLGAERRITNVAAGYAATDAVNVSQLMSEDAKVNNVSNNVASLSNTVNNISTATGNIANISNTVNNITNGGQLNNSIAAAVGDLPTGTSAKQYTDQQINMVQQGVNSVARNAYSGIAAATALTMIPDVDQGKTIAVGVGGGSYRGYQAMALGASARITQNIKIKLGAGISGQGTTVGAGASYQW